MSREREVVAATPLYPHIAYLRDGWWVWWSAAPETVGPFLTELEAIRYIETTRELGGV